MEWNKEQQRAISLRNANILVSAGAGSGKTAVLTERIIQLIEEGASILDFAICTFTEDATLEMKNRIRGELLKRGLSEQADLVYMSDISTIHSLCKRIIKDNFDVVYLPPKFTVLSNEVPLKAQAMETALNTLFDNEAFSKFALKFSPSDDTKIRELIFAAYDYAMNLPDYRSFLKSHIDMYKNNDYSLIKAGYIKLKFHDLKRVYNSYETIANTLPLTEKEAGIIDADIEILDTVMNNLEKDILPTAKFSYKRMASNSPHQYEINIIRDEMKDILKDLLKYGELFNCDEILSDTRSDLEILLNAIITFDDTYSEIKRAQNYLTFNDMEQFAYRILQNQDIAGEYKARYKYIFVDEYQDTSKLQQAIISALSGEKNLFMVGDIKQSIYAFRNADPSMFHRTYTQYEYEGDNVKIDLFRNYRSSKAILDFVNNVFSVLLNISEKYYPKEAYLAANNDDASSPVEIDVVSDKTFEPFQIVKRIKQCLNEGYRPKDIAVLFRSVKTDTALALYRLLKQEGISVDISKNDSELYIESQTFLDLLSIIDNPHNDIPLIGVMYSELGGFTVDDLIEIRKGKKDSFYTCVKNYTGSPALYDKIQKFLSMLEDFSKRSLTMSVDELMSAILMHTGYLKYVETTKDGRAKAGQIYQLIKSAKEFESLGYYGLSGFLEYYSGLKDINSNLEISGFSAFGDAVTIMTMHKSKGLEFPVVIVGDLNKQMHRMADAGYYVFHKDMGIGLCHIDPKRKAKIPTPMMSFIKQQNTLENLEEQMRMLYVAMTRPKERLYIVCRNDGLSIDEDFNNFNVHNLLKGTATFYQALMMGVVQGNALCRINIIDEDFDVNSTDTFVIAPEYNEHITALLNADNDTSTVVVPKKTAVTQLSKEEDIFIPQKAKGKKTKSDSALKGTVNHNLLYHLRQGEDFDSLFSRMKDGEFFSEQEILLADREMISAFIQSNLYERICRSEKVFREKPFIIELDSSTGYTSEPVMAQGIIDCLFEENNEWVLVDYKTDNIVRDAENILTQKYSRQLEIYAYAIEQLTGKKVKEKIIFHLLTGRAYLVN